MSTTPTPTNSIPPHRGSIRLPVSREQNSSNGIPPAAVSGEPTYRSPGQKYLARLYQACEREQRQIAQNLHNMVGQSLTSIGLGLDLLHSAENAEVAQFHRDELQRILQATAQEIRSVMRMVRPEILDDLGVAAAIRQLIRGINSDLNCHFDSQVPPGIRYSEELETAIFRIVEEGLRNVLQHANATQASVQLAGNDHFLRLSVRDNGCGFRWSRVVEESGMGLAGIRCRVELLQGSLEIVSQVGSGTSLHICFPVSARSV